MTLSVSMRTFPIEQYANELQDSLTFLIKILLSCSIFCFVIRCACAQWEKIAFQLRTNAFSTRANGYSANPRPIRRCKHTKIRAQSCPHNQNTGYSCHLYHSLSRSLFPSPLLFLLPPLSLPLSPTLSRSTLLYYTLLYTTLLYSTLIRTLGPNEWIVTSLVK
jgi:hypothetical protein